MPSIYRLLGVAAVSLLVMVFIFTHTGDVQYQWQRLHGGGGDNPDDTPQERVPLRIMFLGASVTRGEVSTGDLGYRSHVRAALAARGHAVNCVGLNRFGAMADNDVEGYGAARVRRVRAHAAQAVPYLRPNLVLVQVGTSDCFQRDDPLGLLDRMRDLADYLLAASPPPAVVLSTLVTTPHPDFEPCVRAANAMIRQVAADLVREGRPVALAEMHYDQGLLRRPRPEDIGQDRIHPTDEGYAMMGDVFLEKIREVEEKGFLKRPVDNGIPEDGEASREVEDQLKEKAEKEHPL
ncbi:carbohydrate esterase family 3 protein [Hypoxylon sp. FL1284]|nr:carbohydrate esterase family 3 protein [Hypoxylon sp. FL1284]